MHYNYGLRAEQLPNFITHFPLNNKVSVLSQTLSAPYSLIVTVHLESISNRSH